MLLTILSALFGGAMRLVPEILQYLSQGQQNAHEIQMQQMQLQFLQVQGQMKVEEIGLQTTAQAAHDQINAIVALNQAQTQMAVAGGWITSALSALVRPYITLLVTNLWAAHKIAAMLFAYHQSGDALAALMSTWSQDDIAIFAGVLNFWFVGRVFDKQRN